MIDFLILYEHKARELENCVYLKYNLEAKGYKVVIASMLSFNKMICKPKVIITPHLYDSHQAQFYTCSIWPKRKCKVISMQYEQVLNKIGRESGIHRPKGIAKNAYHVAWGDNEKQEYLSNGILPSHVLSIGSISLDFDSKYARISLMTRSICEKEFGIAETQELCVFFSSFAFCGRSTAELERANVSGTAFKLHDIMEKSKPVILDWFKQALLKNDNLDIVYRRHPAESAGDESIENLKKEFPRRFLTIDDYSIRHWINVSDYCCTWFSTSSIDAYFAGKPCSILRPFALDTDLEVETMYGVNKITDKEEFCNMFTNQNLPDHVAEENISKFFYNKRDELVIQKYCLAFEKVLNDNSKDNLFVSHHNSIRAFIVTCLLAILCTICKHIRISRYFKHFSKLLGGTLAYYEKEVYGESESILKLLNNIKNVRYV